MAVARRHLKNDVDQRMLNVAMAGQVFLPEKDILALEPKALSGFIEELRKSETQTRHLRKRLEALRDKSARACPACGRPVAGRSDAIYCGPECRVRAHRESRRNGLSRIKSTS